MALAATGRSRAARTTRIAVDEAAFATWTAAGATRSTRASKSSAGAAFVATLVAARATAARTAGTAWTASAARTTGSGAAWSGRSASRFVAIRFTWAARAVRIAVAGRSGVDPLGHVPGAERGWIAGIGLSARLLVATRTALARCARTTGLEWLVRLLGRRFAADGQATVLARTTPAAAAIFARAHAGPRADEHEALFGSVLLPLLMSTAEMCGGFDWDDSAYARAS